MRSTTTSASLQLLTSVIGGFALPISTQTAIGVVHGDCDELACRWLNVSYADPLKRFEQSKVATGYTALGTGGVAFGHACPQLADWYAEGSGGFQAIDPKAGMGEDCLKLNIWSPRAVEGNTTTNSTAPSLPVLFWIHGGGLVAGSAGDRTPMGGYWNDGKMLSIGQNLVVVTINYRLGIFGNFQLADGSGGANTIGDMITALEWTHAHISKFGGDPKRVTIMGESSGSVATATLGHLPKAEGLFQRLILMAGVPYPSIDTFYTKSQATQFRNAWIRKSGLDDGKMRAMPMNELLEAMRDFAGDAFTGLVFGAPSPDGDTIPDLPANLKPLAVDGLIGFTSFDNPGVDTFRNGRQAFVESMTEGTQITASEILTKYDIALPDQDVAFDACLLCQHIRFARRLRQSGGHVYMYQYDFPHRSALHGSDIIAVFNVTWTPDILTSLAVPTPPVAVVRNVQEAWARFAATGELPGWPEISELPAKAMILNQELVTQAVESAACPLWVATGDALGNKETASRCIANALFGQDPVAQVFRSFGYPNVSTAKFLVAFAVVLVACCLMLVTLCHKLCRKEPPNRDYQTLTADEK